MNIIDSIILGVVEGLTEFLPVSSTGHLVLVSSLLGIEQTEFVKSFEIIIQLGAILAVVVLYTRMLLRNWELVKRVAVAFLPTVIIGLVAYSFIKQYLIGNNRVVVISFILGGVVLILFEKVYMKHRHRFLVGEPSYGHSLVIGLAQVVAMIPGVSRSGATIVGGLALGMDRKTIVEFSFLLAIPTMLAASALDLYKNASQFSLQEAHLLIIGFVVSFVVALTTIRWFLRYIQHSSFVSFGIYRILAGVLFALFLL